MIQRIQSIWLFFACASLFALYLFPTMQWISVDGRLQTAKISGIYESLNGVWAQTTSFTLLSIVGVLLAILPFVLIFLFRNRALQIKLCFAAIALVLGFSFWLAKTIQKAALTSSFNTDNFGIGAILPSVAILFLILAVRSIRKDEKLIQSADRLR